MKLVLDLTEMETDAEWKQTVASLESAGERLWNELVAVRGVANKFIALEGRDDE